MKAENRGQRVRGVIVLGDRYTCNISKDNPDCIVAYTHWYRHDDNLARLDEEFEALSACYSKMKKTSAMMMHYEYKDYEK